MTRRSVMRQIRQDLTGLDTSRSDATGHDEARHNTCDGIGSDKTNETRHDRIRHVRRDGPDGTCPTWQDRTRRDV